MGDRTQAPRTEGIGLSIPSRKSDCTGQRPSWYPWQTQVDACDADGPDPAPLSAREKSIGDPQSIPWG